MRTRISASRGFTLIELLVVIAIIGILSSIVLASLNTARNKGKDVSIKANLATIAVQASLYYDKHSSYNTAGSLQTCGSSARPGLLEDPTSQQAYNAATNGGANGLCYIAPTFYAIFVSRPSGSPTTRWCIDSTGKKCGVNGSFTGSGCPVCDSQN